MSGRSRPVVGVVLDLDPTLPTSGGRVRLRSILDALGRFADLRMFVVGDAKPTLAPGPTTVIVPPRAESRAQRGARMARGAFSDRGTAVPLLRVEQIEQELARATAAGKLDAIVVGAFAYAPLIPLFKRYAHRVVLDTQSVESEWSFMMARRAFPRPGALRRVANGLAARRMERRFLAEADQVWAVREADAEAFRRHGARTAIVPNVTFPESVAFDPSLKDPACIAFVGSYQYEPNVEAALVLSELSAWLTKNGVQHRMLIVGRDPTPAMQRAAQNAPAVELSGFAPTLEPYLAKAGILAAPLLSGAGTKLKIVDAMNHGCAIVTTEIGAEGLPLENGENAVIAPVRDFGPVLRDLIDDAGRQRALGLAAREAAFRYASIERLEATLRGSLARIGVGSG